MILKLSRFDVGDDQFIKTALSDVARARGISALSKETDLTRQGLYKSLSSKGDPKLSTVLSVMKALGMRVSVQPEAN